MISISCIIGSFIILLVYGKMVKNQGSIQDAFSIIILIIYQLIQTQTSLVYLIFNNLEKKNSMRLYLFKVYGTYTKINL